MDENERKFEERAQEAEERFERSAREASELAGEAAERLGRRADQAAEQLGNLLGDAVDWLTAPPFLPQETRQHLYAAKRETLLAIRSMLDSSLEQVEKKQRQEEAPRVRKIDLE